MWFFQGVREIVAGGKEIMKKLAAKAGLHGGQVL